jgi:hypothetical protein
MTFVEYAINYRVYWILCCWHFHVTVMVV